MYVFSDLSLAQGDAIFAALRLLATKLKAGEVSPDDGDIGDILTNSGAHAGLSADEVHELCDSLLAGDKDPR